jgi:hypothetical protein
MVDSDDLYGLMEVDNDFSIALGTETLADKDIITPLASIIPQIPGQIPYL